MEEFESKLNERVDRYIEEIMGFHYVALGRSALFRIILEETNEDIREKLLEGIEEPYRKPEKRSD